MKPYLLTAGSFSILRVMWLLLSVAFRRIEKAHEHLRETERSRGSAELVKGSGG